LAAADRCALWVVEYFGSQTIGGFNFAGYTGNSVGPLAKASGDAGWECYAKVTCKWAKAAVLPNKRCSKELWNADSISRNDAVHKCQADANCIGLMWLNSNGGDGRAAANGRYQGCGGAAGVSSDSDWDVIMRPERCSEGLGGVLDRADTGDMKAKQNPGDSRFVHVGTFTVSVIGIAFACLVVLFFGGMATTFISKRRARMRRGVLGNEEYSPMSVRDIGMWDVEQESWGNRHVNVLPFNKVKRTVTGEPNRSLYLQVEQTDLQDNTLQDDPGTLTEEEHGSNASETSRLLLAANVDADDVLDAREYDEAPKARRSEWY